MDNYDVPVKMHVWYKNPSEGEWTIREVTGKLVDSDIMRIMREAFDWVESTNTPISLMWDTPDDHVTLVEYVPFVSLYINWDIVRKTSKRGPKWDDPSKSGQGS